MSDPDVVITDEYVFIGDEIFPIEDFDFSEYPMVAELFSIVTETTQND